MAERRKTKRKKENELKVESEKPSKLETEIAKYLRAKLPQKKTTLLGHKVDYFIASKAIDLLLESKWANDDKRHKEAVFTSRESVVAFMDQMLRHKLFHRARTVVVSKKDKKKKLEVEESSAAEDVLKDKKVKSKKDSDKSVAKEDQQKDRHEDKDKADKSPETETKKKEKKKIKLDMHLDQIFVDENEPYVWLYDHIPLRAWLIGAALVFGAIAVCLFPLWPRSVRNYVYYLSVAAAAFLFFIIGLAVLRLVMFTIVWVITFGKHHFWLLPNLTEDVGFFESFWPLYKHDFKADDKKKKRKDSDSTVANIEEDKSIGDTKESGSESASTVESIAKTNSSAENGDNKDGTNGINGFEILDSKEFEDLSDGKELEDDIRK